MGKGMSMKILVIEDDPSIRETLGIVLEAHHHQADLVDSGEKALVYLAREWPDVMLLDLTLDGVTGEEVYHQIQGRFGKVPPTVVLTAVQQGERRVRSLPGAWYLGKPYTLDQLLDMVDGAYKSVRQAGAA